MVKRSGLGLAAWMKALALRAAPALLVFLLTMAALLPHALGVKAAPTPFTFAADGDQAGWDGNAGYGWSPDEDEYAWTAGYYGTRLFRLDFSPGSDAYTDPGWSPWSHWALTQPMGARLVYAVAYRITGVTPPPLPPQFRQLGSRTWLEDASRALPAATRGMLRLAATLCAALGLALIAWRLSWWGMAAAVCFLALSSVRRDLALAWAEGPLMLGLGLCVLSYGTRWFGLATGLAATFKLTALGLWPLLLIPAASGRRGRWATYKALAGACLVWTVLDPPAWFAGGPFYLAVMIFDRGAERARQAADLGAQIPPRYLWPVELAIALGLALLARRYLPTQVKRLLASPYGAAVQNRWLARFG